jgi:hypothetical protein
MMFKKSHFTLTSLIIAISLTLTPAASQSIALPASINDATIYAKQRAQFATVMVGALWQHARGNTNGHLAIENKLADLYNTECSPEESTQNLIAAIQNNRFVAGFKQFFLGASSSAYQIEGGLDATSAAARFYRDKAHLPTAEDSIDFYNRYPEIIKQMAEELHINSFRISLAWDRIQPQQGMFDMQAIEFYRNVIRTLQAHGIKPMVVFHHYDAPTWF